MKSRLVQDWVSIRSSGAIPVTQAEVDWLDVSDFADAIFWIEVTSVTDPGGGVSLVLETAPVAEDKLFVVVDSVAALAASAAPLVRKAFMNAGYGVPLARFLRWKVLAPGGAGNWGATFRIHVSVGDGVRSAFCPLALPSLLLWYRADLGVTLQTGNKVSQWDDQSGLSNRFAVQTTDANRPIWTANAIGGRPALDFAGSKFLENQLNNIVATAGSAYSVLVVAKNGNGSLLSIRRSTSFSTTRFQLSNTYVFTDGVSGSADITVANTLAETQSASNPFKSCHRYKGSGSNPDIYLNTTSRPITSMATFQTTENGALTGFFVGRNSVADFWNGLIAEIIVVGNSITDTDRVRVEQYQRDFFGF